MNRQASSAGVRHRAKRRAHEPSAVHPRSVPVPVPEPQNGAEAERPFEEGAHDTIDADLRHRMISEAAYALYAQRGYVDGYDVEDWLAAEAEVDHLRIGGRAAETPPQAGSGG